MNLTDVEKSVLLAIYKAGIRTEDVIGGLPVNAVRSLKTKGAIQAEFQGDEIVDVRLWPKTRDYIEKNLL